MPNIFDDFDFSAFWKDSKYAREKYLEGRAFG